MAALASSKYPRLKRKCYAMALVMWIIFSSFYFQKIPGIDKVFAELNSTITDTNVLSGEAKTTVNDSLQALVTLTVSVWLYNI